MNLLIIWLCEESDEGSFVESAASQVSAALESFDEAKCPREGCF